MRVFALLFSLLLTTTAFAQIGDDVKPLTVFPTEGKAVGYVEADEPGKWVVLGDGFLPVQFRALEGGKCIIFEAEPGAYGVLFFPPGDTTQPKVTRVVLAAGTKPADPETPETPDTPTTDKVDAVTYVFEQQEGAPPAAVSDALDALNRLGIIATVFERDTTDGTGGVPEQYKAALTAARNAGLPCIVATSKGKVVRTVVRPTTKEQVLEVVK